MPYIRFIASYRFFMKSIPARLILFIFFILSPSLGYALAGIAESTSYFHYNDYTKIESGHPSDLCWGPTKWCLAFKREDFRKFKGIDSTFEEINVPVDSATPYIIGRRSTDNHWIVYNLLEEQILMKDIDYKKVVEVWASLGLAQPVFVNAHNTRELLTETRGSVTARWNFGLQIWLFNVLMLLVPVSLLFGYLSRKSKQQYKKNGSIVFRLFSYIFLMPVFIVIYIAASSLVQIILHNW